MPEVVRMHVAFGRVRRKSRIITEDADFKIYVHHGFVIKDIAFLPESGWQYFRYWFGLDNTQREYSDS